MLCSNIALMIQSLNIHAVLSFLGLNYDADICRSNADHRHKQRIACIPHCHRRRVLEVPSSKWTSDLESALSCRSSLFITDHHWSSLPKPNKNLGLSPLSPLPSPASEVWGDGPARCGRRGAHLVRQLPPGGELLSLLARGGPLQEGHLRQVGMGAVGWNHLKNAWAFAESWDGGS